ncbi:MAG TPA: aminotransferase class V-fold PLP-dependent enzyme [Puia sp.]|nr:aminotransferase class V-fold PLP-dependent enzyme [Puia sp.]
MEAMERVRDKFFNRLRRKEYARLDKLRHVYLDYTGGSLHPQSLVDRHYQYLKKAVYGNPHSNNPASLLSEKMISRARKRVLDFFNASDYYCVFTHNASGALQIVGECYPFSGGRLLLTADNHNSVNGIREYCRSRGGGYSYSPMNCEDLSINEPELDRLLGAHPDKTFKLFAYPAQSNVSGVRHSLSWIKKAQEKGWDVLLDAAAFVPTSKLDLSVVSPDFVSLSFYKMFGYPTGIGCLLVKRSTFHKLKKPWYAGGTITLSAVKYSSYFLKPDHEKFEDGTVNYLNIPAVSFGLDFIEAIGMSTINSRVQELGFLMVSELHALRHDNGRPLVKLYGPGTMENRGGNFLLNFFDVAGEQYPFQDIEQMANMRMISLRTGCFCNPGIDELNHGLSEEQLRNYFVSRDHGDYFDFINFMGRLRGAVRVSIGLATTRADIERFVRWGKTLLNIAIC